MGPSENNDTYLFPWKLQQQQGQKLAQKTTFDSALPNIFTHLNFTYSTQKALLPVQEASALILNFLDGR